MPFIEVYSVVIGRLTIEVEMKLSIGIVNLFFGVDAYQAHLSQVFVLPPCQPPFGIGFKLCQTAEFSTVKLFFLPCIYISITNMESNPTNS